MLRLLFVFGVVLIGIVGPGVLGPAQAASTRPTVAVLYFDYAGDDAELKVLSKGLASMLITDLSANEGFDVVERDRLQDIIAELELSRSDLVDPAKAVKVGRLVGAQRMVIGRYFEFVGQLRFDVHMVDVETAVNVCGIGALGKRVDFFDIEADLADQLAVALLSDGVSCKEPRPGSPPVVPAKQGRKLEALPVSTAAKYGQALEAVDAGEKEDAKKLLDEVVAEEPRFVLAQEELAKLLK